MVYTVSAVPEGQKQIGILSVILIVLKRLNVRFEFVK
jgi:hypothetical protein